MKKSVSKSKAIIPGSMLDVANKSGGDLAQTWMNADMAVLCDVSMSMMAGDSRERQSRYDVMCYELAGLQQNNPGKIAVISFSDYAEWNPDGNPHFMKSMTDMTRALQFVLPMDGLLEITLISDGEPNSREMTLNIARQFEYAINTVYVGPPPPHDKGRDFLAKLAKATGGKHQDDFAVGQLENKITLLLPSG